VLQAGRLDRLGCPVTVAISSNSSFRCGNCGRSWSGDAQTPRWPQDCGRR
jgi:hypothetical protein